MFLRFSWIRNERDFRWELARVEDLKVVGWVNDEIFRAEDKETIKLKILTIFGIPLPEEAYDIST